MKNRSQLRGNKQRLHLSPAELDHQLSQIAVKRQTVLAEIERMAFKKRSLFYRAVARGVDILLSSLLLLACVIPFLVIGTAIVIDSKGPVFFCQIRVGRKGRCFCMIKFRTMDDKAEEMTGPVWTTGVDDSRITRVGAFLRTTKLDELPQLFNIFLGDMTFVGPRPERPEFVYQFVTYIPARRERWDDGDWIRDLTGANCHHPRHFYPRTQYLCAVDHRSAGDDWLHLATSKAGNASYVSQNLQFPKQVFERWSILPRRHLVPR